jgi:hypothetical protein
MMNAKRKRVRPTSFRLGSVCVTRGAADALDQEDILRAVGRHARRDWGEVCEEDWERNDQSVEDGFRLLSVYRSRSGVRFWAITEADRSVTTSTLVWLERPQTEVPPAQTRGRPPSRERVVKGTPPPIRVDALAAQLPKRAWRVYRVKAGEKGPIRAQFAFVRAVAARDGLPGPDVWVLFRRHRTEPQELKVCLSNAPEQTPARGLVYASGMRWPIETCFEEAKGSLGMADYQTRFWRGWHHHMTLVILAHHFVVRLRLRLKKGLRRSPCPKPANCSAPPCPTAGSRRPKPSNSSATSSTPTTKPNARTTATPRRPLA